MSPSPSYGDRPPLQGSRQSFTTPARPLSHHERAGLDPSDAAAEVHYTHPHVKIVRFNPSPNGISFAEPVSHDTDYPVDTVETLPWATSIEEPLSNGPLRIVKIPGSTNFLKSGNVDFPLMRNSQCWLVDGESKFVLRVGKFQYYRIELPMTNEEERAKVEELKRVLGKVLRYEKTPCPFKRGFHVELPEDALTPRRKGQWKRRDSSLPSTPTSDLPPSVSRKSGRSWKPQTPTDDVHKHDDTSDLRADSGYEESPVERKSLEGTRDGSGSSDDDHELLEEPHVQEDPEVEKHVSSEEVMLEHDQGSETTSGGSGAEESMSQPSQPDIDEPAESSQPEYGAPMPVFDEIKGHENEEEPAVEVEADTGVIQAAEPVTESVQEAPLMVKKGDEHTDQQGERQEEFRDVLAAVPLTDSVQKAPSVFDKGKEQTAVEAESEESIEVEAAEPITHNVQEAKSPVEIAHEQRIVEEQEEVLVPDSTSVPITETGAVLEDEGKAPYSPENRSDDIVGLTSTVDTFRTLASSDNGLLVPQDSSTFEFDKTAVAEPCDPFSTSPTTHTRDASEVTATPSLVNSADIEDNAEEPSNDFTSVSPFKLERPSTPPQAYTYPDEMSPPGTFPISPSITEDARRREDSQYSQPPLAASKSIYVPQQQALQGNHLTGAILRKALSKPFEYAVLLVHVVARIAGGATVNDLISGDLFRTPEPSPVRRRYATPSYPVGTRSGNATDEDDFGVPLRVRNRLSENTVDLKVATDSLLDID